MAYHSRNIWAVQKSANQIYIEQQQHQYNELSSSDTDNKHKNKTTLLNCDISITNFCLNDNNLIVTNNRNIYVYKIDSNLLTDTTSDSIITDDDHDDGSKNLLINQLYKFIAENITLHLYEQSIVVMTQEHVKILSMSGVQLQEINFTDNEGIRWSQPTKYTDKNNCILYSTQ
jgi:hypothetical protein